MSLFQLLKGTLLTTAILEQPETLQAEPASLPKPTVSQTVNPVCFNDFNISDSLKTRLASAGFVTPTPVQAEGDSARA